MNGTSKKRVALIIISVIVCAALFAAYFIIRYFKENKDIDENEDKTIGRLIDINTASNVSAINISNENGEIGVYRLNGTWHFYSYPNLPVSENAVARITSELEHVVSLRDISENESGELEQYGLDKPSRTVRFTCAGETKTYSFGSHSSYYNGYYFTGVSENVCIVTASLYEILDVSLEDMLSIDSIPDIPSSEKLVFTDINGNEYNVEKDDDLYDALLTLEIDRYVDYGRENYEIYGFENKATLTVDDSDRLCFCIGENDEFVYMLVGESEMIYLVKSDDLETLVNCIRDVTTSVE